MSDDDPLDVFFEHVERVERLRLVGEGVGPYTVDVQTASRQRTSVLVELTEACRELVDADVSLRARVEGDEGGPLVSAHFDRVDQALARLNIRPPEVLGRRESTRVDSPDETEATLFDHEEEVEWSVEVLDLGLGGIGVVLPSDCEWEPDDELEVRLAVGSDWHMTCTGQIVYVDSLDERDGRRAGIEFGQLSEEWRQSLLRIIDGNSGS